MKIEKAHVFFLKRWRLTSPEKVRAIGLFDTKELAIKKARLISDVIYVHDSCGRVQEKIIVSDR